MSDSGLPFSDAIEAQRLRDVRALLEQTLREFDIAAAVTLAGRAGRCETFLALSPSWSRVIVEGAGLRLRSMAADYAGDVERQRRDLEWTLGMMSNLAQCAGLHALSLMQASEAMDAATGAEHTPLKRDDPRDAG